MKKFYERPQQVLFIDESCIDGGTEYDVWVNEGIAFEDKIICLGCGSTIELDEVIWMTEISWVALSECHALEHCDAISKEEKEEAVEAVRNYLKED